VSLIILFGVLSFVFQVIIGQVPHLITGIPGIGFAFTIIYSIIQSVAWLLFDGRRWRILGLGLLSNLLAVLFISSWTPPVAMATTVNSLIVDLIFNQIYGSFQRKNKQRLWIILAQVYYWATQSVWTVLFYSLFVPLDEVIINWVIPIMPLMFPIMVVEALVGSNIGYNLYRKVNKIT
jgi:hypothetical protein